jgi:hypothetical protein
MYKSKVVCCVRQIRHDSSHQAYNVLKTLRVLKFTIWRDAPFTGVSVCSFIDSCESVYDNLNVSNIAHVDTGFTSNQNTTYVLTAQLLSPDSAASIIGGFTFLVTVNQLG